MRALPLLLALLASAPPLAARHGGGVYRAPDMLLPPGVGSPSAQGGPAAPARPGATGPRVWSRGSALDRVPPRLADWDGWWALERLHRDGQLAPLSTRPVDPGPRELLGLRRQLALADLPDSPTQDAGERTDPGSGASSWPATEDPLPDPAALLRDLRSLGEDAARVPHRELALRVWSVLSLRPDPDGPTWEPWLLPALDPRSGWPLDARVAAALVLAELGPGDEEPSLRAHLLGVLAADPESGAPAPLLVRAHLPRTIARRALAPSAHASRSRVQEQVLAAFMALLRRPQEDGRLPREVRWGVLQALPLVLEVGSDGMDGELLPILLGHAGSTDPQTRGLARRALGALATHTARVQDPVTGAPGPEPGPRADRGPAALARRFLREGLRDDEPEDAAWCALSLGLALVEDARGDARLGTDLEHLLDLLRTSPHVGPRAAAALALGLARDPRPETRRALLEVLRDGTAGDRLRGAALQALARVGTVGDLPALRALGDDPGSSAILQLEALRARAHLGDPELPQELLCHLIEPAHPRLRPDLAALLGRVAGPREEQDLLRMAADRDLPVVVRRAAGTALEVRQRGARGRPLDGLTLGLAHRALVPLLLDHGRGLLERP